MAGGDARRAAAPADRHRELHPRLGVRAAERDAARVLPLLPARPVDLVANAPLQDAPGTRFADSNTNFVLLGLVVERATHMSLGAALQQRIIRPLGLQDTRYELGTLHGNHLHGYEKFSTAIGTPGPDSLTDMQPVNGTGYDASGAVTSTVGDLGRYLRALLGGRLLRPAQLRAMQTLMPAPFAPGPDPPPFSPSYWGLGLDGTTTRCGPIYGGTGGVLGYGAIMAGTPGGHRIVTLGVNELQSLPGLVAVLQREILPLICPPRGRPSLVAASFAVAGIATFAMRPSRSGRAGGQAGRLALRFSVVNRTNGKGGE